MAADSTAEDTRPPGPKTTDNGGLQFRLTMGVAPGITSLTTSNSTNPDGTSNYVNDGSDAFSPEVGYTLEPGFIYSIPVDPSWGFEVGTSFFYRSVKGNAGYTGGTHVDIELDSYGFDVAGGIYWQLRSWRLEMTPVIGYGQGRATIKVTSPLGDTTDKTDSSPYIDYGFRVGAYYTLPQYVLLGLQVGYQAFTTTPAKVTLADGSSEEDKVGGSGLVAALSFVLVF
jgi:hypothetical protein